MAKRHRPKGYSEHGVTFESAQQLMAEQHYFVLRGFLPPPSANFAAQLTEQVREREELLHVVFNAVAAPEDGAQSVTEGDSKRKQISIPQNEWPPAMEAYFADFKCAIETLMPGRTAHDMVVLYSEHGCAAQPVHADWTAASLSTGIRNDDHLFGGFPAGALLALEPNTALNVWPASSCLVECDAILAAPPTRVPLEPGDLLVFRADLMHGGCAYPDASNVRLHAYGDRRGVTRGKNETFTMQ